MSTNPRKKKKNILHKSVHDGLGNHVNHSPLDNVVVRGDKEF